VEDLERKSRQQTEQVFSYKEQITSLQAEVKMKGSQYEGRRQIVLLLLFHHQLLVPVLQYPSCVLIHLSCPILSLTCFKVILTTNSSTKQAIVFIK